MAEYTSSPLGIINVSSIKKYSANGSGEVPSIFSSKHIIRRQTDDGPFERSPLSFDDASVIHTNDVYDIKTSSIISKLSAIPAMKLKYSDFAYCRDFGVYPNNRLIVCRRFPNFIGDEITGSKVPESNATILSWFSDDAYPLEFSFNEEWTEAEASFKNVLNDVGKDIVISALGDFAGSAINSVPLPGVTELLQRKVLQSLGIISKDDSASRLPAGDPNLIKEAKQRKLIGVDERGSGVIGKFQVKVKCAWEQKFINGVDPTFVYYDILRTILSFGGSDARFYLGKNEGLNEGLKNALNSLENDPFKLITDTISALSTEIDKIKESLRNFFSKDPNDVKKLTNDLNADQSSTALSSLEEATKIVTQTIALKYKIPILGIISALTGLPSTPWHVTIGNPLRPIFCSGDMVCRDVSVKLGSQLSFNDLPSYIECEFSLESARNLGVDEIFSKLSSSQIRIVDGDKFKSLSESPNSFTNSDYSKKPSQNSQGLNQSGDSDDEEKNEQDFNKDSNNLNQSKIGSGISNVVNPDPNSDQSIL